MGLYIYMGVSENSVPLNPMVLLIIIPIKWLFHWEYTLFSDKPIYIYIYIFKQHLRRSSKCKAPITLPWTGKMDTPRDLIIYNP